MRDSFVTLRVARELGRRRCSSDYSSSSCLVLDSKNMPPSKAVIRIDRYDQGCVSRSPICHAQSSPKSRVRYARHSDHGAGHQWDYCSVQSREPGPLTPPWRFRTETDSRGADEVQQATPGP